MAERLIDIREDVLYRLGDDDGLIWSTAEVNGYIQAGLNDLVIRTKPLWDWYYCNDVASTATYELPSDLLVVDRVTWNNARIPPLTARELRAGNSQYRTQEGEVLAYSVEEDGIKYLRKYLVPSATATADQDVNNTRVEYFQRAATLADDLDELDLPRYATKYVRYYALWQCLERKGKGQDLKLAIHYRNRYLMGVKRMLSRREAVMAARIGRLGGPSMISRRLPAPRLPWNYGRIVRPR